VFAGLIRLLSVAREERIAAAEASWPALPKACVAGVDMVDGDFDQALAAVAQTALTNRMDLMNARAQLVDSWRQIAVSANSLLGVVDVQYHLDATTPPLTGNPFAFSTTRTRNQLIFNTELPLVRRLERNQYRTALIAYQRQRRALQAAEDQVLLEVRSEVRQLRVQAENYKIQQRAVLVAYSQRDNSLEVLRAPTQPGQSTAATAASLTQQLLTAQSRVPRNENLLYQFYVNYLIARLQLFRDLDLMPLDPRGVWIDENAARDCDPTCRPAPAAEDRTQPERGQPERLPQPQPGEPVWGAPKR
jgi:outer membrane protein TolC